MDRIQPNFEYPLSLTRSICCYCKVSFFLGKFAKEFRPLIDVRNWFLLNILRMDGQSLTNFFHPFLFISAGNDDMHESSKEF